MPAQSATLHVLDAVFTRMGASDNLAMGRSTFLEVGHGCSSCSAVLQLPGRLQEHLPLPVGGGGGGGGGGVGVGCAMQRPLLCT